MKAYTKAAALAATTIAALSAAAMAQGQAPRASKSGVQTLFVPGYVDWLEKSDVSALREGVIKKMELKVGSRVKDNGYIGELHARSAELAVEKAKVAAESEGAIRKAEAQKEFALAERARLKMLSDRGAGFVSVSEVQKAEAEVKVAAASIQEAIDQQRLNKAERDLADQMLAEHTIRAPFAGLIIERMKHPGESVRANEAVVRMGKIDTLKFFGDIPIGSALTVKEGYIVDVKPEIDNADLPIEAKRFRGKVTYVSRELLATSASKSLVTIHAEVQNNEGLELMPGMKANMTIYLTNNKDEVPPPSPDMLPEVPPAQAHADEPPAPAPAAPAGRPTVGLVPRR